MEAPSRPIYFSITPRVPAKLQVIHSYKRVRYKKTLHRIGGPTWKLPAYPASMSLPSCKTTLTEYLLQGAKPSAALPPRSDWARLAYGTFVDQGQKNDEQEWGPSVRGSSNEVVVSYTAEKAKADAEEEKARAAAIQQLEERLTKAAVAEDVEALKGRLVDERAARLQKQLWTRLVGLVKSSKGRVVEVPNFKTRTKAQSRYDIKKFEKEKRKKQNDKEENRKRRLRNYLNRVRHQSLGGWVLSLLRA